MTEQESLIPTAQIVFDAFWMLPLDVNLDSRLIASLQAAVDQVLPMQPEPMHCSESEHAAWFARQDAREDFMMIINSLKQWESIHNSIVC